MIWARYEKKTHIIWMIHWILRSNFWTKKGFVIKKIITSCFLRMTHSVGCCKQKSMPKGYSFLRLDQIYYYFLMYSFGFPFSCPPTTLYVHDISIWESDWEWKKTPITFRISICLIAPVRTQVTKIYHHHMSNSI